MACYQFEATAHAAQPFDESRNGNQGTATKTVTVSERTTTGGGPVGGGATGGGSTGGGSTGGGSTGGGSTGGSSAAVHVSAPRKLKARAKSLPVTLTTDRAGKASFALVRSGRVIARGSKAIGAGTASYKLKLPRKAKAGKYVLKVTFTPAGGKASTKTIKVKLAGKAKDAKASASAAGRRARVSGSGAPSGPHPAAMAGVTIAAAPPRRAPVRSRIARALFERAVSRFDRLEVIGPDGSALRSDPGAPRMEITSERFFDRLGRDGKIGFGEAYMAGDWRTADLPGVLLAFAHVLTSLIPPPFQRLRGL